MKSLFFSFCIILSVCTDLNAQNRSNTSIYTTADSLNLNYYQTINKNPKKGLLYAEKAFSLIDGIQSDRLRFKVISNYATALFINEEYLKAYDAIKKVNILKTNTNEKALYHTIKGLIANDLNHLSEAESDFKKSLELYEILNDRNNQFAVLNNLGLLYNNSGEYKKSLEAYLQCYDIINDLKEEVDSYKYFLNMGTVSYNLNDYESAYKSFNSALTEARTKNDSLRIYKASEKLGQTYVALDSLNLALTTFEKVLPFYEKSGLKKDASNILLQLGNINYALGYTEKGFTYFKDAEHLSEKNSFTQNKAQAFLKLGNYYNDQKKLKEAEHYFKNVLKTEDSISNLEILKQTYFGLYSIAKQKRDIPSSLLYLEKGHFYETEIQKQHLTNEADQIEARLGLKKKELELENLKINYELNQLQIKGQKQKIQGLIIFALLIGVLLWLALAMYFQKQKSQKRLAIQNDKINIQNKELIETNAAIKEQRQELATLNSLKDELLSILAHDVKSPITNLSHLLFILRNNLGKIEKEELQKNLASIEVNSSNLLNLLNNILNWVISQSQGVKVKISDFSLTELIQQNLKIVDSSIVSKDLKISFNDDNRYEVSSDRNIVDLAMRNLLSNAVKFTPRHGTISIEIHETNNYTHTIKIIDSGIGFNEKVHAMLKEDIEKVPVTSGTAQEKGYGIGLSLCKKMLMLIDSKIMYERNLPQGSIFTIHLKTKPNNI